MNNMSEQIQTIPRKLTGKHLGSGNEAVAEGALTAGLHAYFGYPITPSTSIMEHIAKKIVYVENPGVFLQAEDEIASITAVIGSSWTRSKAMTATSGPGFSLMQEGIGLASFTETPLVLVLVMRGGPSTGLPTFPAQQELMQTHFGSHGDYLVPTLAPSSVQECFNLSVEAFNIAEALRTPVFLLSDQVLSTLKERYNIPEQIEIIDRAIPNETQVTWKGENISEILVPPMNCFGEEKKAFSTGLSHDPSGQVDLTADNYESLMNRLRDKILNYEHLFPQPEEYQIEDADVLIVAYGSTARSAKKAVQQARKQGLMVGLFRPVTIWPFPGEKLLQAAKGKKVIVVEMSSGQLIWPVERYIKVKVHHIGYLRGRIPQPSIIINKIKEVLL